MFGRHHFFIRQLKRVFAPFVLLPSSKTLKTGNQKKIYIYLYVFTRILLSENPSESLKIPIEIPII